MNDTTRAGDKSLSPGDGGEDSANADDALTEARTARLARDTDGTLLGAAVFLGGDDLKALGIELNGSDAGRVAYQVADGTLRVAVGNREGDQ